MKRAYFSKRIYKNSVPENMQHAISHTLRLFNQAKHFSFQLQVKEKRSKQSKRKESMHLTVKNKYSFNDYYANSVVQEANALFSSQEELKKMYIQNKKEQINSIKKKIKSTKSRLTFLQKIKDSFVKGKPKFNKSSREQQKGNYYVVEFKKQTNIYYHAYQFEHEYLDKEITFLKAKLGRLKFKLDRFNKQLHSLGTGVKSVVFMIFSFSIQKILNTKLRIENTYIDSFKAKLYHHEFYPSLRRIIKTTLKAGFLAYASTYFCFLPDIIISGFSQFHQRLQ